MLKTNRLTGLIAALLFLSTNVQVVKGTAFKGIKLPIGKSLNSNFILDQIQLPEVGGALLCSIYCSRTWKCLSSIVSNDICMLYKKIEVIDDPQNLVEIKYSYKHLEKVLLFRHIVTAGSPDWFEAQSSHGSWNINEDTPTATKYSVLKDLDNFRDKNGVFHFELCYPGDATLGEDNCFVFDQINDLRTADPSSGFVLHRVPKAVNADACVFDGLRADSSYYSWIDGNTGTNWWFSLGARRQHAPGVSPAGSFPGPCRADGEWSMTFHVELYAVVVPG